MSAKSATLDSSCVCLLSYVLAARADLGVVMVWNHDSLGLALRAKPNTHVWDGYAMRIRN